MQVRPSKTPPAHPEQTANEPARTLAQEKSDFTAEGSPPPGQVADAPPELPADAAVPVAPDRPSKAASTGRRQPPAPAGPVRRASKRNPGAWRGNG